MIAQAMAQAEEATTKAEVLATGVSFEEFLEKYAELHCEWVAGEVHKMPGIELQHLWISAYLRRLFEAYFDFNPIAFLLFDPFVMWLAGIGRGRAPDLMIVMKDSKCVLHHNYLDGPADIAIEIVSPSSISTDHGEKYEEYERGGVPEYWILDFVHQEARFYRMNERQRYVRFNEDVDGSYTTPRLPKLKLHVPTLWQTEFPGAREVLSAVQAMWEGA